MAYELRPYQLESVEAVKNLQPNFNGILSLSTGTGKTVIMASIANEVKTRCLIVVQSKELRDQTKEKLHNTNPNLDVGLVQASLNQISNKVVIATRQSLSSAKSTRLERMSEYGDFELVFFDECHVAIGQIKKILDKLNPNIKVIGLSATPIAQDMKKVFHR